MASVQPLVCLHTPTACSTIERGTQFFNLSEWVSNQVLFALNILIFSYLEGIFEHSEYIGTWKIEVCVSNTLTACFTIECGIKLSEWVRDKYYLHSISFLLLATSFLNMVSTW